MCACVHVCSNSQQCVICTHIHTHIHTHTHTQDLRSSESHKEDLLTSAEELRQKLAKEAELCRDLTSDLTVTKAELVNTRDELAKAEEAKGALQVKVQQLQVCIMYIVLPLYKGRVGPCREVVLFLEVTMYYHYGKWVRVVLFSEAPLCICDITPHTAHDLI